MSKKNVKEIVTEIIIKKIQEDNLLPWQRPWFVSNEGSLSKTNLLHPNKRYSLLNHLLLSDCEDEYYLTMKQVNTLKAHVKKGAQSHVITFWKICEFKEKDDNGQEVTKKIPLLRYYRVFGVSDVEGLSQHYLDRIEELKNSKTDSIVEIPILNEEIQNWIANIKADIRHSNPNRAFYSPTDDYINVPPIENFKEVEEYYVTSFHELVHWTGHESRLDRLEKAVFGSETYSKEELVAEIGATLLRRQFYGENIDYNNSASYIKSWLEVLKNDSNFIISASSKAEKAVQYLNGTYVPYEKA